MIRLMAFYQHNYYSYCNYVLVDCHVTAMVIFSDTDY